MWRPVANKDEGTYMIIEVLGGPRIIKLIVVIIEPMIRGVLNSHSSCCCFFSGISLYSRSPTGK